MAPRVVRLGPTGVMLSLLFHAMVAGAVAYTCLGQEPAPRRSIRIVFVTPPDYDLVPPPLPDIPITLEPSLDEPARVLSNPWETAREKPFRYRGSRRFLPR